MEREFLHVKEKIMSLFKRKEKMLSVEDLKIKDSGKMMSLIKGDRSALNKLRILVVDDQEFPYTGALQEYQYHVEQMKDATPDKAAGFDVILCDRKGVGKALKSSREGGALALAIKERFPLKFVALYTTATEGLHDIDVIRRLDDVVQPGGDADDFKAILDAWSEKILDPKEQWIRLRGELLKNGVSIHEVAMLEHLFVSQFNCGEINDRSVDKFASLVSSVGRALVIEFFKLACFKLLPELILANRL